MKESKKIIIIFGIILFIATTIILYVNTTEKRDLKIITTSDSYAEEFAKKENLKIEILSDSNKNDYVQKFEFFSYNKESNGITITNYQGKSEQIIIPRTIDGKTVLSIESNAFNNNPNLKSIIIPQTISKIDESNFENIEISCYKNTFCENLKSNENLTVVILDDSEKINFNQQELLYEYNINNKVEITKYNGYDENLIIPSTINGYEVKNITMDINKDIKSIYIPKEVTTINFNYLDSSFNTLFYIATIFNVLSIITFIIINTIATNKTTEQTFNSAPIRVISILYLLSQMIYSIISNLNNYELKTTLLIMIILLIGYTLISAFLLITKNRIESYDTKIKNIDTFIKYTLNDLEDINLSNYDENLTKTIEEIKELIRYSDPVSTEETKKIETEIKEIINKTKLNTIEDCQNLIHLIEKRNRICKNNK